MTDLFGESSQPAVALARKWRPRRFADLTGQEHVVKALSNALTQGRLHHAYLFTGTRGVGKTTLARILAKCLNCETGVTAEPCGECSACRQIDAGRFVDLLELDAASNTGVDNMREVLDNAQYAPSVGRYKVYIIDEVHMLSKPAFNSMLKTLEEPPEHVKFILATTDPQKIPVTVLSRCLQFNLKPMTPQQVVQRLGHVLAQENIAAEPAALNLLARAANGSMRDALSLTDQAIAHGGGQLEAGAVEAMLGSVGQEYLFDILDALLRQDADTLLAQPQRLSARGISLAAVLQDLGGLLTRIALSQAAPGAVGEDEQNVAQITALAEQLDAESVQLYYQIALNGRRDLPFAPDELAGFSMTLLRMLAFAPGEPRQQAAMPPVREVTPVPRPAASPKQAEQSRPAPAGQGTRQTQIEPASPVMQDWPEIVAGLKLGGMARMLADQCELKSLDGSDMRLGLAEEHKHLLDKTYQEKLIAALRQTFGDALQVRFEMGVVTGLSPVEQRARDKAEKQAMAVEAIEGDPFVRDLVEQFDARIDPASIQLSGEAK
jgi:DNA polymerase III subunit gamma/tau